MIDWRHKLALFYDVKRASITIGIGMIIFVVWDLLGIHLGIFFSEHSLYSLPYMIVPNFPIEELLFLFLLCYVTLLIYNGMRKIWKPIS
jgi:lycopene cyclase domain-containing protein